MPWSWEDAAQGAALGSAGFATGNPIVGAVTTLGGGLIGGLAGGGGGGGDPPPVQRYQAPPTAGFIGGTNVHDVRAPTESMSDDELYRLMLEHPEQFGLTDEQSDVLYGRGDYAMPSPGIGSTGQLGDVPGGGFGIEQQGASAKDPYLQLLLGQIRNANPDVATGQAETPWAVDQGRQDVVSGDELVRAGLTMEGRAPTVRDESRIDAGRGAFGESRQNAFANASQAADDRALMSSMLEQDRGAMQGQLAAGQVGIGAATTQGLAQQQDAIAAGQGQLQGQLGQGQEQLDYLRAVQRGEAGPSLAEQMSNRLLGEQVQNQMAMAKSGSSFSPGAQRQATMAGSNMADAQRQQVSEMRAREQLQAQQLVGSMLGQQQAGVQNAAQFGLGGQQTAAQFGLQGAGQGAQFGLQGAGQIGQLGTQGTQALAGLTQAQQQAWLQQQQQDAARVSQEMGWQNQGAQLTEQQRARDDAYRQYLASLGMDVRGQGYNLLAGQAGNQVQLAGIESGAQQAAQSAGQRSYEFDTNRRQQAADRTWQGLGTVAGAGAEAYAASRQDRDEDQP